MREIVLELSGVDALALIRDTPGLLAAHHGKSVWVKGIPQSNATDPKYWQLPFKKICSLDSDGYLYEWNTQVPFSKFPDLAWQPLADVLKIIPPVAAIAGQVSAPESFRLVPSAVVKKSEALITSVTHLKQYAQTAYRFRLQSLRMVVNQNGQALLLGNPLPPLPGREYWFYNNMLLPCGYQPEYEVTGAVLAKQLTAGGNMLPLFAPDGSYELIPTKLFTPVTRSSVRQLKLLPELC